MKKTHILWSILLFFLIFSSNSVGLTLRGSSGADSFTSESAFGNIVEKSVSGGDNVGNSFSSIMFSWGGPLRNGTGTEQAATAGLGISAAGDIYTITMGPELEEEQVTAEQETPEEQVEESSGVPSSGGGGGGSSSRDTYGLLVGDKLTVLINGKPHTIEITEIRETSALLTVESTPMVVEINEKETVELDLDGDGLVDMGITLDDVSELRKITITVEDLTWKEQAVQEVTAIEEVIAADPLERITGAVVGLDIDQEALKEIKEEVQQTTSTVLKYILLVNILVGALLGTVIAAREIHRRRIYKFFHKKSKQEIVRDKLKELEVYVQGAYDGGMSFDEIKDALSEAGWYEYEIDEVVTNIMLKKESSLVIRG